MNEDWCDLAGDAWVLIATVLDGEGSSVLWHNAAERWVARFRATLAPATMPPATIGHLEAIAANRHLDGAERGQEALEDAGPVSAGAGDGSGTPGATQGGSINAARAAARLPEYRGEWARVDIMGHDQRTGWVTDGSLAGSACLDVRDVTGRLIAKIPAQSVYMYSPLEPPFPGQEHPALPPGRVGAWDDYGDEHYAEPVL